MPTIPQNAVLIPIDMQRAFDAAPWPPRWNDRLDANGLALLSAWRAAGRPVIHMRHDSIVPGSTLRQGTAGNAHRPGFEPQAGEPLVTKSVNAAFIGTDLELRLRRLGADTIVYIESERLGSFTVRLFGEHHYAVGDLVYATPAEGQTHRFDADGRAIR